MTSRYLKCNDCGAVLDRRQIDDWAGGGTYPYGSERELFAHANAIGWKIINRDETHYCPKCAGNHHDL
jgi:ssDNA-binding Zn-finger/Zn-ribbon topoisomerase 1